MGHPRADHRLLGQRLPSKVGERGAPGRVGDADVHHPADASLLGPLQEGPGVPEGLVEGHPPIGESNPIGVVEDLCAAEAGCQGGGIVEGVGYDAHLPAEGVGPARVSGQGAHLATRLQEPAGDGPPCVAEGSCDRVHALPRDGGVVGPHRTEPDRRWGRRRPVR